MIIIQEADIPMKKLYVSPEAVKVNFEANDIIAVSGMGMLIKSNWNGWDSTDGIMSISWNELIGNTTNE